MKRITLLAAMLITFSVFSQGVTNYHMVYVKTADQAKFEEVEKNYMSKLAQEAVDKGQMMYWALEKVVNPNVPIGGKLNHPLEGNWYQFVIVHNNLKSYLNVGPWWQNAGERLNINPQLLSYTAEQGGMYLWNIEDTAWGNQVAKYSLYNFGFAEEPQTFLDIQKPYKKTLEAEMKKGEAKRAGWVSGTRISPNNWGEHNVMTWDGFMTLEDALSHLLTKGSAKTFKEWGMSSGFDMRIICEKIVETTSN